MVIYLAPNVSTWAPEIFFKIILNLVNNDNQFGFKSKALCFSGLLFRKFPIFRNCSNCLVRWWWSATSSIKLKKLVSSRYTQLEVWQTTKPWPISRDQSNWQTDSNRPGFVKSISRFYIVDSTTEILHGRLCSELRMFIVHHPAKIACDLSEKTPVERG